MSKLSNDAIIRAWKDPMFRASLTPEEQAALPPNPSGPSIAELNEEELTNIVGGIEDGGTCCKCCKCSCSA